MQSRITTFLMFAGRAEEAVRFYADIFPDSQIEQIEYYGVDEPGPVGTVKRGRFRIGGQTLMFIDSPVEHAFTFTPAISLFVDCDSAENLDRLCARLSEGGSILMPLAEYPFSRRFVWLNDRFGVSWQLNLA